MEQRTYTRNGDEFIVEECETQKEFVEWALGDIEAIEEYHDEDARVYIEYKNGDVFDCMDGFETVGKFRRTGIAFGVIDNGSTQQVFGAYEVDENGIVQRREA